MSENNSKRNHLVNQKGAVKERGSVNNKSKPIIPKFPESVHHSLGRTKKSARSDSVIPEYHAEEGKLRKRLAVIEGKIADAKLAGKPAPPHLVQEKNKINNALIENRNEAVKEINDSAINDVEIKEPVTSLEIKNELLVSKNEKLQIEEKAKEEERVKKEKRIARSLEDKSYSQGFRGKYDKNNKSVRVTDLANNNYYKFRLPNNINFKDTLDTKLQENQKWVRLPKDIRLKTDQNFKSPNSDEEKRAILSKAIQSSYNLKENQANQIAAKFSDDDLDKLGPNKTIAIKAKGKDGISASIS